MDSSFCTIKRLQPVYIFIPFRTEPKNQKIFIREIDFLKDFAIEAFKENNVSVFYDEAPKLEVSKLLENGVKSLRVFGIKREEILGYAFFNKADIKKLMEKSNFLKELVDGYKAKRKNV